MGGSRALDAAGLDVEGVGVLEDGRVALQAEDEAVEGISAEGGVDVPDVAQGAVLDTGC